MNAHSRFSFYLRNAVNSLLRERRRAVFALFTVAVGVAAIVGLQLTADTLENSLTTNVRSLLRGDLAVHKNSDSSSSFEREEMDAVQQLKDEGLIDDFTIRGRPSEFTDIADFKLTIVGRDDENAVVSFYSPLFLEKDVYPYYGDASAGGKGLWELIEDNFDVVVTRPMANRYDINVGEHLKLGAIDTPFTVKAILPTQALGRTGSLFFGDVVFRLDTIERIYPDLRDPADEIYILAPERSDEELAAIDERLEAISPLIDSTTPAELERDNQDSADDLRTVLLIAGLVALAIGGLGIANTMQVLVSRRLPEAGVLKALGLKGRQVMTVFLTEALIIGALGSVAGIAGGILVSLVALRLVRAFVPLDLSLSVGTGPIVMGLFVGVLVTVAFGLLPTVGASHVRPMAAIRPHDSNLVKGSWLRSSLLLLGLAVAMGIMVGVLTGNLIVGLIGTLVAFIVVGLLLLILVGFVYVLSRLPSFGRLTLHLSFLEWRRHKTRAAALLLAMSIGVLGIALILMLVDTFISGLRTGAQDAIGGDVIVIASDPAEKDEAFDRIRNAEGVSLFSEGVLYDTKLVAINGDTEATDKRIASYKTEEGEALNAEEKQAVEDYFSTISVREIDGTLPKLDFGGEDGRMLDESDVGRNSVVLTRDDSTLAIDALGLEVGDVLSFHGVDSEDQESGSPVEFEIVGISAADPFGGGFFAFVITANDPFEQEGVPSTDVGIVQVDEDKRDELVRELNLELDSVFVIEVRELVDLFASLLKQFRTFPLVLTGLSFLAAVVIIANAVALSTIERREEIGLLKAVGAKARWVVFQLALENTLLGLLGGLIGLGIAFGVLLLLAAAEGFDLAISIPIVAGVLALSAGLSLIVTLFSALPAARERPLDILRGD